MKVRFTKNIHIKEKVNRENLISLYQDSNVFVLPSIFGESFGIVLLEAMASKTPLVATNQGGIKEIIKHCETVLLLKKNDVLELAENILTLLNDKKLSAKLSSNAFKMVNNYDWSKIAEKIEMVYED